MSHGPAYRAGDIWDQHSDPQALIGITTSGALDANNHLVMNAGIALQAAKRYPRLSSLWGKQASEQQGAFYPYTLTYGVLPPLDLFIKQHAPGMERLFALQTRYQAQSRASESLVMSSLCQMHLALIDHDGPIHLPFPGIGHSGLSPKVIQYHLDMILDDRHVIWRRG